MHWPMTLPSSTLSAAKQGRRAVALVVVGHGAAPAALHRQSRLGAVERLDLRLLIASKSLANRRLRLSQAKVRSTTQRRGKTEKPVDRSERLTISICHCPCRASAVVSLSPA